MTIQNIKNSQEIETAYALLTIFSKKIVTKIRKGGKISSLFLKLKLKVTSIDLAPIKSTP